MTRLDTKEWERTSKQYVKAMGMTSVEGVNQITLDILEEAFHTIPPNTKINTFAVQDQKRKVKAYLEERLLSRIRFTAKGKSKQRGKSNDQLQRVHLIVNARRAKRGLPGLRGNAMRKAAGVLKSHAQRSVGFLKALFYRPLLTFNRYAKFKFSVRNSAPGVSVWREESKVESTAFPARGDTPIATFELTASTFTNHPRPRMIVQQHLDQAAFTKLERMKKRLEKMFQKTSDRFSKAA